MNKTALALGSFDGLHRGHMRVLTSALSFKERGFESVALLFDEHPLLYIGGEAPPKLLQKSETEKILENLGIKTHYISFSEIKDLSCEDFFNEYIIKRLNAGAVCCGWNYRFGKGGEGDSEKLRSLCSDSGIEIKISDCLTFESKPVSSTLIRSCIENGDIKKANAMLGRRFCYTGAVVPGCQRGRLIGAPTINQYFDNDFIVPKTGVYSSVTEVDGRYYHSVTNIGLRPTFENEDLRSETYIINFDGDLYGRDIKVSLIDYIRGESRFDSIDALKERIVM
nr:riboflavin biosynthesis protein RibF [Clostridiales bacterium]